MADTSLDEFGLRIYDSEGHRLYWHRPEPARNYEVQGKTDGLCTVGHVWAQDGAHSPKSRPGRLRRLPGVSTLVGGLGAVRGNWIVQPGGALKWWVRVVCRRGDDFLHVPPYQGGPGGSWVPGKLWLVRLLYPSLELAGWSWADRIECPVHAAERKGVEKALRELRAAEHAAGLPLTPPDDVFTARLGLVVASAYPVGAAGARPRDDVGRGV